jgi:plasmid maintenance system antidote protein VapI
MAIAAELKAAIDASKKSYNQLETEIGIGRGVIGRFVKGQRDIGLETAEKIAEYFGLHLCPTEEELDRTAQRIAAMREEAETAQTRLMKVQESMAILLRMGEVDHLSPKGEIKGKTRG